MDSELDWQRVRKLFAAILELDPEQWQDYLQNACDDESLRRKVAVLLAAHRDVPAEFLRAVAGPADLSRVEPDLMKGRKIGPYRLVECLGTAQKGEESSYTVEAHKRLLALYEAWQKPGKSAPY